VIHMIKEIEELDERKKAAGLSFYERGVVR
jgi:hypothetical protein